MAEFDAVPVWDRVSVRSETDVPVELPPVPDPLWPAESIAADVLSGPAGDGERLLDATSYPAADESARAASARRSASLSELGVHAQQATKNIRNPASCFITNHSGETDGRIRPSAVR